MRGSGGLHDVDPWPLRSYLLLIGLPSGGLPTAVRRSSSLIGVVVTTPRATRARAFFFAANSRFPPALPEWAITGCATYDVAVPRPTANRPLTSREQEVLRYLLSFEPPPHLADTHRALIGQIEFARVTGQCDCGCATVDLSVDQSRARRAAGPDLVGPYSEARHITEPRDLLLFVQDGWLLSLEIVDYDDVHSPELPEPLRLGLPQLATWS